MSKLNGSEENSANLLNVLEIKILTLDQLFIITTAEKKLNLYLDKYKLVIF